MTLDHRSLMKTPDRASKHWVVKAIRLGFTLIFIKPKERAKRERYMVAVNEQTLYLHQQKPKVLLIAI